MLCELVEFVHVDVDQKLRGEVAERNTNTPLHGVKAFYDFGQKPENVGVGNVPFQNVRQYGMVDIFEKLPYVAFEHPCRFRMVFGYLSGKRSKSVYCLVHALFLSARVGMGYESVVEKRIQHAIESVVQEPIAHFCFVDVSRFRVGDIEGMVRGVFVGFRREIIVQGDKVSHEIALENLHVFFCFFTDGKLAPCKQEIFERYNRMVRMNTLSSHTSPVAPLKLLPVLQKLKEAYVLWFEYYKTLPKAHRYSLGKRVDDLFVASIEGVSQASFLPREKKLPYVQYAIQKLDTVKIFLMILWETKSLDNKKYIALSLKLEEIGRMLGGWSGQIAKQNSPNARSGEK